MLGGPPLDVGAPPDLALVEPGDGLREVLAADELLHALSGQAAEQPGDLCGTQKIFRTGAGSHLTNTERVCERKRVVKRLDNR